MTVSVLRNQVQYTGNNSTTQFTVNFPFTEKSQVKVYLGGTLQTITTHYTLTDPDSTGTVTFVTAPGTGVIVSLIRETDFLQTVDYANNDILDAETLEAAFDKLTMMCQQVKNLADKSVGFDETVNESETTSLKLAAGTGDLAGKLLAFDDSGNFVTTQEIGTFRGNDTTTTTAAYVVRDLIRDSSNDNVYFTKVDAPSGTLLTNTTYFELLVDVETVRGLKVDAETARTGAETAETNAEAALASFQGQYKSSATDPYGGSADAGDLWYDETNSILKYYTGSAFEPVTTSLATVTGNYLTISNQVITAGVVPVSLGGTGSTTASGARTALGVSIGSDVQAYDAGLNDISSLAVTDGNIIVGDGSNWVAESGSTARASLGVTIGSQVQAWDQQLDDISALAVTDGNIIIGNGTTWVAESGATARESLGLTIGTDVEAYSATNADYGDTTANFTGTLQNGGSNVLVDSDIGSTVQGYDANTAKLDATTSNFTGTLQNGGSNVVVDSDIGFSVQGYDADTAKYDDTTANFTGTLQNGGSNVVVDSDIGSSVQAYDAGLTSIAGLTTAADKMIYTTASDSYSVADLTAAGRALLDDADSAAQRTTLGLGTAATSNTSAFEAAGSVSTHAALTEVHGISAFGATLVDDADAAAARTTLGVDVSGTDNSTPVSLITTSHDYLTLSSQQITLGPIVLTDDVSGILPIANGGTSASTAAGARTALGLGFFATRSIVLDLTVIGGFPATAEFIRYVTYNDDQVLFNKIDLNDQYNFENSLAVSLGGTGGTTASAARTNLGLGSLATQDTITESQISDLQSYITASSTDTLTNKSGNISQWTNDAGYLTAETNNLSTVSGTLGTANGGTGVTALSSLNAADLGSNNGVSDATDGYVLTANGTGGVAWEAATGGSGINNLVEDLSPQLGGNLDVNGQSIVSVSAGNISITPDTTGKIILDGLSWPTADGTTDQVLKTDGSGNLSFVDHSDLVALPITDSAGNNVLSESGGVVTLTADEANVGSNALVVDSSGNVGIGTSSPQDALHLSAGNLLVGKTAAAFDIVGVALTSVGEGVFKRNGSTVLYVNRGTDDGDLIRLFQADTLEGNISVSGSTVSYNGGHLSRFSQLSDNTRDESIVKGTVMSNLDQMAEWTNDGITEDNEQLNCMKVSDVEGDINVAGVFVNWDNDDDIYTNDMNIAMTGDMVIRIAKGTTVQRGDLLMSAGDGTAKPQVDDIVRSKTIAKVTSTHVSHTYEDGSYLVPCVLMAC